MPQATRVEKVSLKKDSMGTATLEGGGDFAFYNRNFITVMKAMQVKRDPPLHMWARGEGGIPIGLPQEGKTASPNPPIRQGDRVSLLLKNSVCADLR